VVTPHDSIGDVVITTNDMVVATVNIGATYGNTKGGITDVVGSYGLKRQPQIEVPYIFSRKEEFSADGAVDSYVEESLGPSTTSWGFNHVTFAFVSGSANPSKLEIPPGGGPFSFTGSFLVTVYYSGGRNSLSDSPCGQIVYMDVTDSVVELLTTARVDIDLSADGKHAKGSIEFRDGSGPINGSFRQAESFPAQCGSPVAPFYLPLEGDSDVTIPTIIFDVKDLDTSNPRVSVSNNNWSGSFAIGGGTELGTESSGKDAWFRLRLSLVHQVVN